MMTFTDKNSWIHIIRFALSNSILITSLVVMLFTLPVPLRLLYIVPIKTFFTQGYPYKQAEYLNENKQFRIEIKKCKEYLWIIHMNDPFVWG